MSTPTAKSAPATDPDTRRAELVAAGVRVLRRLGFERMTLRDVAKEAGVSIGLLQHYFETREQLARECFAAACGDRARAFSESASSEGTARDRVRQMIDHAFDKDAVDKRASTWIDLCSAAGRNPALRLEAVAVQDVWRSALSEAISEGEANGEFVLRLDRDTTVETLLALVDGIEVAATISDGELNPDALHTAAIAIADELLGVPASS